MSCARNDCSRSIVWDHLVPGRAVQVAWDLPQASPRCPCWLRWAHPRLCLLQVLSVLGFPSGVARAVSFVCRRRMPSEPDVFYRCRARLMALVPKAGMDSPLLCFARNDRFPGLPSRDTAARLGCPVSAGDLPQVSLCCSGLFLTFICCQAGPFSVRRRPVSGFTSLVLDSLGQ